MLVVVFHGLPLAWYQGDFKGAKNSKGNLGLHWGDKLTLMKPFPLP